MKRQHSDEQQMIIPIQEGIPNFILVDQRVRVLYQKYHEMYCQNKERCQTMKSGGCWIIDNQTGQIICE